ncbi:MAG: hypothetical protein FGF48_10455, partial [Candidatus Brockarchaeota archaeon]|nr:hypothetical protein [Candidatus Brockarchaeota archaeon]
RDCRAGFSRGYRFKVGDRVYGYLPIRETHTVSEQHVMPLLRALAMKSLRALTRQLSRLCG